MDKPYRFDNRITPAVMRTQGVIKVTMMEERFSILIGCADLTAGVHLLCLRLCTSFTLSLFAKRDRPVGALHFQSPVFHHLPPAVSSQAKANSLSFHKCHGSRAVPSCAAFSMRWFFTPWRRGCLRKHFSLCSRLLWFVRGRKSIRPCQICHSRRLACLHVCRSPPHFTFLVT